MLQSNQPYELIKTYINIDWYTAPNRYKIPLICREIQLNEDSPLFFISRCPFCGLIFHSKNSSFNHFCTVENRIIMNEALIYLINWISVKMLSLNSIEDPFFNAFCHLLNPNFIIPNAKLLRSIIIQYSKSVFINSLNKMQSKYVSIMIDGTTRWRRHYISIILFSRLGYTYYITKKVYSENSKIIDNILNECIGTLRSYKKTVCAVCSDNFSANKKACIFKNLNVPLYRQYCNCHCASLAVGNLFGQKKPRHQITINVQTALKLLKYLNPPHFTEVRWKSLSECVDFVYENQEQLIIEIESQPPNKRIIYDNLTKINWKEIKDCLNAITSFIIQMEDDNMRIEFVFQKLFYTISVLQSQKTDIANDMVKQLLDTYLLNDNLKVPLAAFLLTANGSSFWNNCNDDNKEFYFKKGISGITKFCIKTHIRMTNDMKKAFHKHLEEGFKHNFDPVLYWKSLNNSLSETACRILNIPCSEASVERLFGGLSYMVDATSTRMNDDLINAEMVIRMSNVFDHQNDFNGCFSSKLQQSNDYLNNLAFPDVQMLIEKNKSQK